jgi:deoxyribonuclease V
VDISYEGDSMYAAAVCLRAEDLVPVDVVHVKMRSHFPYVPTYLAYREFPGIQAAVSRLSARPDALLIDGHGRLHPARFGIACHAGVRLDIPTIGVAKHSLVGRPKRGTADASAKRIEFGGRTEGFAWTPPGRGRPIFVSVGHRISLEQALSIVKRTTIRGYPEPLRLADRISKERKQKEKREKGAMR